MHIVYCSFPPLSAWMVYHSHCQCQTFSILSLHLFAMVFCKDMETQLELHASATTCHVSEMEFKDLVDGALQRPGWVAVGIVVSLYLWQYYKLLPFSYHIRLILILLNRLLVKTKPFKTASDVSVPTANAILCNSSEETSTRNCQCWDTNVHSSVAGSIFLRSRDVG